jgi:hypothetical protein
MIIDGEFHLTRKKLKNKHMKTILFITAVALLLAGCKKDNTTTPVVQQSYAEFLKNTEWVGTLDGNGFQYRLPCSLKFNADNTFTMYSLFVFFPNGVRTVSDSITGTIISMDSLPDGRTLISTNITTSFNGGSTQSIYITDRKKISGISSSQGTESFSLSLFPATGISVLGTWIGPAGTSHDNYTFAYPDLSTIAFTPTVTYYARNGVAVLLAAPNTPLQGLYLQKGARVYFSGCNETKGTGDITLIPYFGVLLPNGNEMMVHSDNSNARLPNYINTNQPFGHNGTTPIVHRQ